MNEQRSSHRGYDIVASAHGIEPGPFMARFSIWEPDTSPPERVHLADVPGDFPGIRGAIDAAIAAAKTFIDELVDRRQ